MAAVTTQAAARGTVVSVGSYASVITTAETNQLRTGAGKVSHAVVWGDDAGTSAVLTIYDATGGSATPKFRWVTADGKGTFALQIPMSSGIRVISEGTFPTNGGITVVWEK